MDIIMYLWRPDIDYCKQILLSYYEYRHCFFNFFSMKVEYWPKITRLHLFAQSKTKFLFKAVENCLLKKSSSYACWVLLIWKSCYWLKMRRPKFTGLYRSIWLDVLIYVRSNISWWKLMAALLCYWCYRVPVADPKRTSRFC